MFLPRVNCRRFASWYKDGEPNDMSPTDSQVSLAIATATESTEPAPVARRCEFGFVCHVLCTPYSQFLRRPCHQWSSRRSCFVEMWSAGAHPGRLPAGGHAVQEDAGRVRRQPGAHHFHGGESKRSTSTWNERHVFASFDGKIGQVEDRTQPGRRKFDVADQYYECQAGPEAARAFLSQCQYTVNYWMLQHGFSIGIGDTVADGATMLVINQTINRVRCLLGTSTPNSALRGAFMACCRLSFCSCRPQSLPARQLRAPCLCRERA